MKIFEWAVDTKLKDIPKWLNKLIPSTTNFDQLDEENQFDHVRFRVMHEIDITEEEGIEETGMTKTEYKNAIKFMEATGGRLK